MTAGTDSTLENRLPFIAAIISGVISIFIAYYVTEETITVGVGIALLLLSSAFFRFGLWAVMGSFLIGLIIDLSAEMPERSDDVILLGALLLAGTFFQLLTYGLQWLRDRGSMTEAMSIGLNTTFAFLGILMGYTYNYYACSTPLTAGAPERLSSLWLELTFCGIYEPLNALFAFANAPVEPTASEFIFALIRSGIHAFVLLPFLWSAAFAALSAADFNIFRPLRFFGCLFATTRVRSPVQGLLGTSALATILVLPRIDQPIPDVLLEPLALVLIVAFTAVLVYNFGRISPC